MLAKAFVPAASVAPESPSSFQPWEGWPCPPLAFAFTSPGSAPWVAAPRSCPPCLFWPVAAIAAGLGSLGDGRGEGQEKGVGRDGKLRCSGGCIPCPDSQPSPQEKRWWRSGILCKFHVNEQFLLSQRDLFMQSPYKSAHTGSGPGQGSEGKGAHGPLPFIGLMICSLSGWQEGGPHGSTHLSGAFPASAATCNGCPASWPVARGHISCPGTRGPSRWPPGLRPPLSSALPHPVLPPPPPRPQPPPAPPLPLPSPRPQLAPPLLWTPAPP